MKSYIWPSSLMLLLLAGCAVDEDPAEGEDPACAERVELSRCFSGRYFAECGGEGPPEVWCKEPESGRSGCVWFGGGCPAVGYDRRFECTAVNCLHTHVAMGTAPWTRERAMNIDVVHVPELSVEASSAECECDGCSPPEICAGDFMQSRHPRDGNSWVLPGMVEVDFFVFGGDRLFKLEVDLFADVPRARVCVFEVSDAEPSLQEPICAMSGSLELSDLDVGDSTDFAAIEGRLRAEFPAEGHPLDGLTLSVEFSAAQ